MRKILFAAAAIAACALSAQAIAQPVSIDRKQVSPDAARKMVDACLAFAQQNNIRVGVAVVDIAGVLIDFHAMPGGGAPVGDPSRSTPRHLGSAAPRISSTSALAW